MANGFIGMIAERLDRKRAKLAKKMRSFLVRRCMEEEFVKDPNYCLERVSDGFLDRIQNEDDEPILRRILNSYRQAKNDQLLAPAWCQVSNEWLPIYTQQLGDVMSALMNEDISALQVIYGNFWRNPCSAGLVGLALDMRSRFFGSMITLKDRKLFLMDTLYRFKLWKTMLGQTHSVQDLTSPLVGNPYGYILDGTFVKSGSDYLHYYAVAISRLVRGTVGKKVVMELGGGYGGMAYYLARDNTDCTYVDFDLPENMALTAYYLLKALPDKKVLLYGEGELDKTALDQYDIVIMPNYEIMKMPTGSVDLAFNSYSLAEMSPEAISQYISEFTRTTKQYLFHINHTRHSKVGADEFGIDPRKFDLLYRVPALWNSGRNPDMDEFEFLYRKI